MESSEAMTTESLMVHSLERGLLLADFNELSVGMIVDYVNHYDQIYCIQDKHKKNIELAQQKDFDRF
ncbi:MAG: hypothetical protein J6F30_01725 [Cellulosilyticum sp.]|nr:hypothetical protein [Cellulosilyticum sp.]